MTNYSHWEFSLKNVSSIETLAMGAGRFRTMTLIVPLIFPSKGVLRGFDDGSFDPVMSFVGMRRPLKDGIERE